MSKLTQVYGGRAYIEFHSGRGDKHYYVVSIPELDLYDLFQPSVTGVLSMQDKSGALVHWATNCLYEYAKAAVASLPEPIKRGAITAMLTRAMKDWRRVKDEKADIGSVVHRVLEQELLARAGKADHPKLPLVADPILAPGLDEEMIAQANNCIKAGFQFFDEHHIELIATEAVRWSPKYGYLGTGDLVAMYDGVRASLDYKSGKRIYPSVWLQLAAYQKAWEEEFPEQPIEKRVAINVGRDGILSTQERDNTTIQQDFAAFLGLLRIWRWNEENKDYKPKPAPQIVGAFYEKGER